MTRANLLLVLAISLLLAIGSGGIVQKIVSGKPGFESFSVVQSKADPLPEGAEYGSVDDPISDKQIAESVERAKTTFDSVFSKTIAATRDNNWKMVLDNPKQLDELIRELPKLGDYKKPLEGWADPRSYFGLTKAPSPESFKLFLVPKNGDFQANIKGGVGAIDFVWVEAAGCWFAKEARGDKPGEAEIVCGEEMNIAFRTESPTEQQWKEARKPGSAGEQIPDLGDKNEHLTEEKVMCKTDGGEYEALTKDKIEEKNKKNLSAELEIKATQKTAILGLLEVDFGNFVKKSPADLQEKCKAHEIEYESFSKNGALSVAFKETKKPPPKPFRKKADFILAVAKVVVEMEESSKGKPDSEADKPWYRWVVVPSAFEKASAPP